MVSNDVTTNVTNTTNRPASEPTGTTCTGIHMYATICVCHTAGKFSG